MLTQRVEKVLVCSECGRPLTHEPIAAASVDRPVETDDDADAGIIGGDQNNPIETVIEEGPVCERCAEYR